MHEDGYFLQGIEPRTCLPFGVSRYYARLAESKDPDADPIAAQYIPRKAEVSSRAYESSDPISDRRFLVTERLIHRYRDRALLLVSDRCATYCRHCFRRHFTGHGSGRLTDTQLEAACDYLARTPSIKELLLSGGDPLMLSNAELGSVIARLKRIDPAYIIRICTRIPVVLPTRVTPELAGMLGGFQSVWAVIHANHPRELTDEFGAAARRLTTAGVPVLNQAVLLRGINDDADILESLFRGLVRCGVKPYYLFQCDLAAGTSHFRVDLARGIELMRELRDQVSGIALPTYAVDLPDGEGKVPVEQSLLRTEGHAYVLRGADGAEHRYPREAVPSKPPASAYTGETESRGSGGGGGAAKMAVSTASALDWYKKGSTASDAGKYQEAITDFQRAISLKADYAEAYNMLGFSTWKTGKVKDAFAYYEKALTLKPNFPEAREYYGEAFLQEGNLARAVQQYIILQKAGTKNAAELLEKIGNFVDAKS